ncbi:MAG: YmdB family metallophosphoesterase [Treponema sp.]|jgi:metallophosphoesterase (TIGR00282 family)|nr:YmdB family metallophosphoesterase [Treponema sp.]
MMRILYIAEIVGKAGIFALKQGLPELRRRYTPDFIIADADGATGGSGLGRNHAIYLRKLGIHVLTTGECSFYKKDLVENIEKMHYVLRPSNLNANVPGYGSRVYRIGDKKIAVAVLLGQSGFLRTHGDNPIMLLPILVERLRQETPFIIVDFHAQTSAEKKTLFAVADGLCSAVIGSHSRVQTADETVLPGCTAVLTDAGRTGSIDSVGGNDAQACINEYLTGIPDWTHEAWGKLEVQGAMVEIDEKGKAVNIVRVQLPVEPEKET